MPPFLMGALPPNPRRCGGQSPSSLPRFAAATRPSVVEVCPCFASVALPAYYRFSGIACLLSL